MTDQTSALIQALRERVAVMKGQRANNLPKVDTIEALPALMKTRRQDMGLSMRAASQAVEVPMMTYRRFELGECDRLRLPHIARMLHWLERTKP